MPVYVNAIIFPNISEGGNCPICPFLVVPLTYAIKNVSWIILAAWTGEQVSKHLNEAGNEMLLDDH